MYKICSGMILIVLLVLSFPGMGSSQDTVTLNDLVEKGKELDGKTLTVQGEAIGEALERGAYAWVNINDGTNAMGIWMKIEDAKKLAFYGDYKHKGDTLRVTGIFNRACKEHGGDMDIHADTVAVVANGYYAREEMSIQKIIAGAVLLILALIAAGAYFFGRKGFNAKKANI